MTLDEKRAVASLVTIPGYEVLLTTVVKLRVEELEKELRKAFTDYDILALTRKWQVWKEVYDLLSDFPKMMSDTLKEEKDPYYG